MSRWGIGRRSLSAVAAAVVVGLVFFAGSLLGSLPGASAAPSALDKALDYLAACQRDNGGFSTSKDQGEGATTWVVMAIAAAGQNPSSWTTAEGKDPISYLRDLDIATEAVRGQGANNPAGFYARLILAFTAAGRPDLVQGAGVPRVDLIQELLAYQWPDTGNFSLSKADPRTADVASTIWAVMALAAAGGPADSLERAVAWLKEAQSEDGGYGWQTGAVKDVDDTAAVVMALRAAGLPGDDPVIQRCLDFIKGYQTSDGGFRSWMSTGSSSESTAWVIGALASLGQDPNGWQTSTGATPYSYLQSCQMPSGLFAHQVRSDGAGVVSAPLMGTSYVTVALSGQSYPVRPGAQSPRPDPAPLVDVVSPTPGATLQDGRVHIEATYSDAATGIDTAAVKVSLDGTDVTGDAVVTEGGLTFTLASLKQGEHSLSVTVKDRAGNTTSVKVPFYMAAYESPTASTSTTSAPTVSSTVTTLRGGASGAGTGTGTGTGTEATTRTTTSRVSQGSHGEGGTAPILEESVGPVDDAVIVTDHPPEVAGGEAERPDLSGYKVSDASGPAGGGVIKDFVAESGSSQAAWAGGLVGTLLVLLGAGATLSYLLQRREERRLEGVVTLPSTIGSHIVSPGGQEDR